jgi:hypothetical protein
MSQFGSKDLPWTEGADDHLGLKKFATALETFVLDCDTPMTVAIQGEWGAGKTSMMNMVEAGIKERKGDEKSSASDGPIYLHSFETWQYGAVGDDGSLGLNLLTNLVDSLASEKTEDGLVAQKSAQLKAWGRKLSYMGGVVGRATVSGAVSSASGGFVDGGAIMDGIGGTDPNSVADLTNLKSSFAELVARMVENNGKGRNKKPGRVIVFVDDLDRIRPGHAVSLLEILKNFLDVPNCVFVVACDYAVVEQGVREKMGIRDPEKVAAFFHKIFQVPFVMPTQSYQIRNFLVSYLKGRVQAKRQVDHIADDVAKLIELSIGTNPRAFKRFLNVLDLLSCMKGNRSSIWTQTESIVSLIGLVAMQTTWPQVANYITECEDVEQLTDALNTLRRGIDDPDDADDSSLIGILAGTYDHKSDGESWKNHPKVVRLSSFAEELFARLNANFDDNICEKEGQHLMYWAKELSLTNVHGRSIAPRTGRRAFRHEVKKCGANEVTCRHFLQLVTTLASFTQSLENVSSIFERTVFKCFVRNRGNKTFVTGSISAKAGTDGKKETTLELKVSIGRTPGKGLEPFQHLGVKFLEDCAEEGIKWSSGTGTVQSYLRLTESACRLTPSLVETLGDKLNDLAAGVDQIVQDGVPDAVPETSDVKQPEAQSATSGSGENNMMDLILEALREAGEPMHYRDITEEIVRRGYVTTGKTPEATVNSKLSVALNDGSAPIYRAGPGTYGVGDGEE